MPGGLRRPERTNIKKHPAPDPSVRARLVDFYLVVGRLHHIRTSWAQEDQSPVKPGAGHCFADQMQ